MGNERRFENGIEYREDRVVQDAILYRRLVDATLFRIADGEGAIRLMLVGSRCQLPMQSKEVLLQISLKLLHVFPSLLSLAKLLPSGEEGFLGCDSLEEMPEYLHCGIVMAVARCAVPLTETAICYKLYQGVLSEHRQGFGSETSILRPF